MSEFQLHMATQAAYLTPVRIESDGALVDALVAALEGATGLLDAGPFSVDADGRLEATFCVAAADLGAAVVAGERGLRDALATVPGLDRPVIERVAAAPLVGEAIAA